MPFKAGSIVGEAKLDTTQWEGGMKKLSTGAKLAMAAVAAVVVAGATKAIQAADEWQKAFANVTTLIDTTVISTQELAKGLLLLDPQLGSTQELTEALYQSFSAGAEDAEEAMKLTATAAIFGKAAITDTFTAVDVLTTATNAYGKETVTATEASDIFFQTIKLGKITGDELAGSIGTSIPLFASAGISLEELAAGMAAMTKQGVNANLATTQLNSIVLAFLTPSEEMAKALNDIGFESGAAFLEAEGLSGALRLIEESTGGATDKINQLLPESRALRGALALTGTGAETFNDTLTEMSNATGATDEAFAKQELTFETLRNSMAKTGIILGNIGKNFLDKIAVAVTASTESFIKFILSAQAMNFVADVVGTAAGAFEVLKIIGEEVFEVYEPVIKEIFAELIDLFADVIPQTTESAGGWKLLSTAIRGWAVMATFSIRLVKVQITALADFVRAINESAETISIFFAIVTNPIGILQLPTLLKRLTDSFKDINFTILADIDELMEETKKDLENFSGDAEDLAVELAVRVKTAFEQTGNEVRLNWDNLSTGQQDFFESLGIDIEKFNKLLGETTEDAIEDLEITWDQYFNMVLDGINKIVVGIFEIGNQQLANQQALNGLLDNEDAIRIEELSDTLETELSMISDSADAEIKALRDKLDSGLISRIEFRDKKEAILAESLAAEKALQDAFDAEQEATRLEQVKRQNDLAEKQFKANKASKIAGILIDTASSIVGWWAVAPDLGLFGPIFAGIMTAVVSGIAIGQIAAINEQKFVPALARGGMTSGLTRINEVGGEVVTLPDGSQVIPNDISRQIAMNSNSGTVINVSFDGARISDNIDLERVTDQVIRKLGRQMRIAS